MFADDIYNNVFTFNLQDSKLRQIVTLGSQDTLEEKTVTVCFGSDFVNVSFINFCATRKEIALVNISAFIYYSRQPLLIKLN